MIESPWLIQTGCSRSMPSNRPSSAVIVTVAGPYSRWSAGSDLAAQLVGHQLRAVADAEDGDAGRSRSPDRPAARRRRRREVGPPDRMIAAGVASLDLGQRRVVRQELGVDVELAHAARDELGELAPEVEDHDRVGLAAAAAGGRSSARGRGRAR